MSGDASGNPEEVHATVKHTIALRLDPETRHKLDLLAEAGGCPPAALVAEAVRRFVDSEFAALATAQEQAQDEDGPPPERWNLIV